LFSFAKMNPFTQNHGMILSDISISGGNPQFSNTIGTIYNVYTTPQDDSPDRKRCIRALFSTDPTEDRDKYISFKGRAIDKALIWITQTIQYQSWLNSSTGSQLLWICGRQGVGKTMMSIFLSQHLEDMNDAGSTVLYYFCEGRDQKRSSPVNILRALIYTLVKKKPALMKHLLPEFEVREEALFSQDSIEALWRILMTMIQDPDTGSVYCVVDGLDECMESSPTQVQHLSKKLAMTFSEFQKKAEMDSISTQFNNFALSPGIGYPQVNPPASQGAKFKLILVSRNNVDCISTEMSRFHTVNLGVSVATQQTNTNVQYPNSSGYSESLSIYIREKVAKLSQKHNYDQSTQEKIAQDLLATGDGTFLWINMALEQMSKSQIAQNYQPVANLSSGTDGLYCQQLLEIPPELILPTAFVLRWITAAFRPLKLEEVGTMLSRTNQTLSEHPTKVVHQVVQCCTNFLDVSDAGEIKLSHQAAKAFLTENTSPLLLRPSLSHFHVDEPAVHAEIAQASISYLEDSPFRQGIYHFSSDFTHMPFGRTLELDDERIQQHPFLQYSSLYWPGHMKESRHGIIDFSTPFFVPQNVIRDNWFKSVAGNYHFDGSLPILHIAALFDLVELVEHVSHQPNFDHRLSKNHSGKGTPLFLAADRGNANVCKFLLQLGANLTSDVFHQACHKGYFDVVKCLLDYGISVDIRAEETLTSKSIRQASRFLPKTFVGKLVDFTNESQEDAMIAALSCNYGTNLTPLHNAALCGNEAVVNELLIRGADVGLTSSTGWTALHFAAWSGQLSLIELLVQYRGNIRVSTSDYWTVLHISAMKGNKSAVEYFFNYGINIDAITNKGETALHLASSEGQHEIVRLLLQNGGNLERKSAKGLTALHLAAIEGQDNVIQILLDNGANRNATSPSFKTAEQMAKGGINSTTALLLRSYQPDNSQQPISSASAIISTTSVTSAPIQPSVPEVKPYHRLSEGISSNHYVSQSDETEQFSPPEQSRINFPSRVWASLSHIPISTNGSSVVAYGLQQSNTQAEISLPIKADITSPVSIDTNFSQDTLIHASFSMPVERPSDDIPLSETTSRPSVLSHAYTYPLAPMSYTESLNVQTSSSSFNPTYSQNSGADMPIPLVSEYYDSPVPLHNDMQSVSHFSSQQLYNQTYDHYDDQSNIEAPNVNHDSFISDTTDYNTRISHSESHHSFSDPSLHIDTSPRPHWSGSASIPLSLRPGFTAPTAASSSTDAQTTQGSYYSSPPVTVDNQSYYGSITPYPQGPTDLDSLPSASIEGRTNQELLQRLY
jgi:ankyrin repeat protein